MLLLWQYLSCLLKYTENMDYKDYFSTLSSFKDHGYPFPLKLRFKYSLKKKPPHKNTPFHFFAKNLKYTLPHKTHMCTNIYSKHILYTDCKCTYLHRVPGFLDCMFLPSMTCCLQLDDSCSVTNPFMRHENHTELSVYICKVSVPRDRLYTFKFRVS